MNRIEISSPSQCCGCSACVQKCPKKAICMKFDAEGFMYPQIDDNLCIDCGACVKVCHLTQENINFNNLIEPLSYCAYNTNDAILKDSSSGGVFWLLVEHVIGKQGVVYGAVADGFNVYHKRGVTLDECTLFRKSKYLQSDTKNTYIEAKRDLQEGKIVLYSGTPCQIAGLYSFLSKQYDNLLTCEVVCHGVPSLTAFNKWLEDLTKEHNGIKPVSMVWRDKTNGWGPNHVTYKFEDGSIYSAPSQQSLYQKGFLDNLYLRPSCYECHYARLPRIADITLADCWGYSGKLVEPNKNKGLSMVIVSTVKGKEALKSISNNLVIEHISLDYIKQLSRHVWLHPEYNPKRPLFFKYLSTHSFSKSARKFLYQSRIKTLLLRIKNKIKCLLHL